MPREGGESTLSSERCRSIAHSTIAGAARPTRRTGWSTCTERLPNACHDHLHPHQQCVVIGDVTLSTLDQMPLRRPPERDRDHRCDDHRRSTRFSHSQWPPPPVAMPDEQGNNGVSAGRAPLCPVTAPRRETAPAVGWFFGERILGPQRAVYLEHRERQPDDGIGPGRHPDLPRSGSRPQSARHVGWRGLRGLVEAQDRFLDLRVPPVGERDLRAYDHESCPLQHLERSHIVTRGAGE
jgi:hypothetical protein